MSIILVVITAAAAALAASMGAMLWINMQDQRRRAAARIAALAADIYGARPASSPAPVEPASRPRQELVIAAAGISVFAAVAFLTAAIGGFGATPARPNERVQKPAAAIATVQPPLELMALTHEREHNELTVRGVVRNPVNGGPIDNLSAVVFVFDRSGSFVTSSSAAVASSLASGGESSFVVTVPNIGDIGRYRVRFRAGSGVLAHVDRRG